jgi:membrane protein YqaA with SNARE-associated domain
VNETTSTSTRWLAFAWGLAEATVFFIVPDVLLTRLALKNFRSAWTASLWAVGGALLGGTVLYLAARNGVAPFLPGAFNRIPGISPGLIEHTGVALKDQGLAALASGALAGQPYKLYAVHAGLQHVPFLAFIAASAAARLARFLLTAGLIWGIGLGLRKRSETFRLRLHLGGWVAFYIVYFTLMPG